MNWYKKAKHTSDHSHSCIYCEGFLLPKSFSTNPKHHFPWGIVYECSCKKSQLWTNSIRGRREFMDIVFGNAVAENSGNMSGFCNDLFCPICFSYVAVLKNGLYMDGNKPVAYLHRSKKDYYITDYETYIRLYNDNPRLLDTYNKSCMGSVALHTDRSVDIMGCRSLKHNIGIIPHGYSSEYGESEYKPIYDWIRANKNKIPKEMIDAFKNAKYN